ncbi:hypothetical protein XINFAN_01278 [Pseudogemmobacter humi]|uniref:Uncharacterized protein n=2 Tax=Pseudogemmobacter humi TaxID=2483812 RepID=A0A3P5WSN0_9RHOB|nr:hypothetical protein XINFAN_01278 [Pseudogemmobacter humi]
MRLSFILSPLMVLVCTACVDPGGDGVLTHSEHSLTAADRARIEAGMAGYLKTPVQLSGLRSSYGLGDGNVQVCGYVTTVTGGRTPPPALFAGTLLSSGPFVPYRVPGAGQDPQRIAAVQAFCRSQQIEI